MNYVPMQKAFTRLNECIRIPICHGHQIFVEHSHGSNMATKLGIMLMGKRRTGVQ